MGEEKNQLIKLHNKKQISFSNKLINKLSQQFKFKNEEVILYLKGKSYKHIRMLEEKASVKILSISSLFLAPLNLTKYYLASL